MEVPAIEVQQSTSRPPALIAGGVLLVVLGVLIVAGTGAGTAGSPGVGILAFAVAPIASGVWAIGDGKWARGIGLVVSLVYAAIIGFVATTPLRGLTPPPGQSREPMDPISIAVTFGFLLAGVLLVASRRVRGVAAQS